MRVTLIEIVDSGDVLLCLEGSFIVGANPSLGDPVNIVQQAARNLAEHFGVELERVPCSIARLPEDWTYADVVAYLFPETAA